LHPSSKAHQHNVREVEKRQRLACMCSPCLACICSPRRIDPPSQVREAEAEKRKAAAAEGAGQGWRKAAASATAAGKPPNMGMALPGMGGPGADKAMQVCGAAAEGPA